MHVISYINLFLFILIYLLSNHYSFIALFIHFSLFFTGLTILVHFKINIIFIFEHRTPLCPNATTTSISFKTSLVNKSKIFKKIV